MGRPLRKLIQGVAGALVGFLLCLSVVLPWFHAPVMGWSLPVPAWNNLGLLLLVLGNLHFLRAVGVPGIQWGIRILLPWAIYRWWAAEEAFKLWGKQILGPAQLKLVEVNQVLTTVQLEPVTVFDPTKWRELDPGLGWQVAGVSLALALLVTCFEKSPISKCSNCSNKVSGDDPNCHHCGHRLHESPTCPRCFRSLQKGDRFCRGCGHETNDAR